MPHGDDEAASGRLLTRRSALGIGAGAAAGLALQGLPVWARARPPRHRRPHRPRPDELPFPDRPMGEPGIPAIEHVVLLMLENHSADNVLGMLPQASAARSRDFDGLPVRRDGKPIAVNLDRRGRLVAAANGTIFDRLDAAGVSWTVYYDNTPSPFYFPNFRDNPLQVARCVKNAQFFSDASAGRLPAVSYVEENFSYQAEENPQDIAYGEAFLRRVATAVMESPLWPKTVLFVTYDEHGGWYDHVPPPRAVPPDDIPPDLTLSAKATFPAGFDRYGFRVPLTVVSPWGQPHYVSHRVADLTSILAFIEHKWNLPPMTRRDAAAWDLSDMFDTTSPRLPEPLALPPSPDIGTTLAACRAHGESPPTDSTTSSLPGT